jgi:hypothetical protein
MPVGSYDVEDGGRRRLGCLDHAARRQMEVDRGRERHVARYKQMTLIIAWNLCFRFLLSWKNPTRLGYKDRPIRHRCVGAVRRFVERILGAFFVYVAALFGRDSRHRAVSCDDIMG